MPGRAMLKAGILGLPHWGYSDSLSLSHPRGKDILKASLGHRGETFGQVSVSWILDLGTGRFIGEGHQSGPPGLGEEGRRTQDTKNL